MREGSVDPATSLATVAPGDLFAGRYEVLCTLKSGNGVETFHALDREIDRDVVVKCIDPGM